MREIKFKLWLGYIGKMTYENSLNDLIETGWVLPEDIIPLQFTGLKDKNGKEIYEGDIVRYTLRHDFSNKELIGEVEWFKYAWRLNSLWLLTKIYMIEVIGNVFEHPALLK